ncbi:GrpE nucleotide exchange factor [Nannochloropsis gaditana]|uniref:GrpE nucleotide exchange factor n=1 Tax=Nannochloropsis gaditana TaxID=72520 RepID=W7U6X5_9STRA|nr:GrpE nucleotide exchange factor [Nannochloropsis gaditana]
MRRIPKAATAVSCCLVALWSYPTMAWTYLAPRSTIGSSCASKDAMCRAFSQGTVVSASSSHLIDSSSFRMRATASSPLGTTVRSTINQKSEQCKYACTSLCNCATRKRAVLRPSRRTRLWATAQDAEEEGSEEGKKRGDETEDMDVAAEEGEGVEATEQSEEEEAEELSPEDQAKAALRAELKELEKELAKKRNELTEAQDRLKTVGKEGFMRLAAEVETYKRRRADGLTYVREEAAQETMKQLLPVFDLMEELEERYADVSSEASLKVLNGYKNLLQVFVGKAERLGVKVLEIAAGDAYDEESMEVGEVVVGEADGVVVEVEQKGYQIGERVARRARVKVSATEATLQKAKEEEKEEEGDSEAKEDSGQE